MPGAAPHGTAPTATPLWIKPALGATAALVVLFLLWAAPHARKSLGPGSRASRRTAKAAAAVAKVAAAARGEDDGAALVHKKKRRSKGSRRGGGDHDEDEDEDEDEARALVADEDHVATEELHAIARRSRESRERLAAEARGEDVEEGDLEDVEDDGGFVDLTGEAEAVSSALLDLGKGRAENGVDVVVRIQMLSLDGYDTLKRPPHEMPLRVQCESVHALVFASLDEAMTCHPPPLGTNLLQYREACPVVVLDASQQPIPPAQWAATTVDRVSCIKIDRPAGETPALPPTVATRTTSSAVPPATARAAPLIDLDGLASAVEQSVDRLNTIHGERQMRRSAAGASPGARAREPRAPPRPIDFD